MAYPLSATKLQDYSRCPQAYYFKYERGLKSQGFFKSPELGKALHKALAKIYWEWHYQDPLPNLTWVQDCWQEASAELSADLEAEGDEILQNYYYQFIVPQRALYKPLGVEGKIQASLNFCNVEFKITGRYDRLDYCDEGIELIDYKSNKKLPLLEANEIDLQIGLYYLALEKQYKHSLKRMTLLYLQLGEEIVFEATPQHQKQVETTIGELALQLRSEEDWEPTPGEQCRGCAYSQYCSAVTDSPAPLPDMAKNQSPLQLTLGLD